MNINCEADRLQIYAQPISFAIFFTGATLYPITGGPISSRWRVHPSSLSGISNKSIEDTLVQLLGKPISESNALFVPTGVYPFMDGPNYAWWPIAGKMKGALVDRGWKTMGLFEFTALPSIKKDIWVSSLEDADALLVWGGDPLYLAYWFEQSGLAEVLTSLNKDLVYVGVSAGSMAVNDIFGETYSNPRGGSGTPLTTENVVFNTGEGEISRTFLTGKGAGLTDFAVIPYFNNPNFQDACGSNAEKWAAKIPVAVYAIDEQTAIKVVAGQVEIVSEGQWRFFSKRQEKVKFTRSEDFSPDSSTPPSAPGN